MIRLKPQSPVINWSNPLAAGLVWCTFPGQDSRQELVSGGLGSLTTSGGWTGGSYIGSAGESTSTTNGGIYYPFTQQLTRITNQFSVVAWARLDTLTSFSHLVTIPYSATWSSPFCTMQFLRDSASNNLSLAWAVGGTLYSAVGSTNAFMQVGPLAMFGASVNDTGTGGVARFFKNGVFGEQATRTGVGAGNLDFGNKREVILLNHNSADLGEGIDGVMPYAAIWNRKLSDQEMMQLYVDPFGFISSARQPMLYQATAAATQNATAYMTTNTGFWGI